MELLEAMKKRHSVRNYDGRAVEPEAAEQLRRLLEEINRETGLHLQLQVDEPQGFTGILAHYGTFAGVRNYLVMAGPKDRDREIGYYGEKTVLTAQALGLNTCWTALTYNKRKAVYELAEGEKLYLVIALGYGTTQGAARRSKTVEEVSDWNGTQPDWYRRGVEAALLAPTAVNQQKFSFEWKDGCVIAHAGSGFYTEMDLGIAQYHFDLASGRSNFGEKV